MACPLRTSSASPAVWLALLWQATQYRAVKRVYARETGESPAYAQLPQVTLKSPKLKTERTTAWFARSVQGRFEKCQARYRAMAP